MDFIKRQTLLDFMALTKPRITLLCLTMAVGGYFIALSSHYSFLHLFITMFGISACVGSANAFNMIYERHLDKLMARTSKRPTVLGRISPKYGYIFAAILGILGTVSLYYYVNFLTAMLGLLAIVSYCAIYTPLKTVTPLALVIGAFPGAVPPLMGWTAVTGQLDWGGIALYSILFTWQMPHFIAISVFRMKEYRNAGIKVLPVVRGEKVAKIQSMAWTIALLISSVSLTFLNITTWAYGTLALILGTVFFYYTLKGFQSKNELNWARSLFFYSLIYLPLLVLGIFLDQLFLI